MVSQIVSRTLAGASRAEAIESVCAHAHLGLDGLPERVYPRTLYRWLAAFDAAGIAGLEPGARTKMPASHALPEAFTAFLITEKRKDRPASIPEFRPPDIQR